MSYTKTTWSENDIITADKLNNIEEGISNSLRVYEIKLTEEEISNGGKIIDKETFDNIRSSFLLTLSQEGTTSTDETSAQLTFVRVRFEDSSRLKGALFTLVEAQGEGSFLMVAEMDGEYSLAVGSLTQ